MPSRWHVTLSENLPLEPSTKQDMFRNGTVEWLGQYLCVDLPVRPIPWPYRLLRGYGQEQSPQSRGLWRSYVELARAGWALSLTDMLPRLRLASALALRGNIDEVY